MQLQHSTNLNIQRSQSTHRFNGSPSGTTGSDTNRDRTGVAGEEEQHDEDARISDLTSAIDSNLQDAGNDLLLNSGLLSCIFNFTGRTSPPIE